MERGKKRNAVYVVDEKITTEPLLEVNFRVDISILVTKYQSQDVLDALSYIGGIFEILYIILLLPLRSYSCFVLYLTAAKKIYKLKDHEKEQGDPATA